MANKSPGRPTNKELDYDANTGFKVPTPPTGYSNEQKKIWRHQWKAASKYIDLEKDYYMMKQLVEAIYEVEWKQKCLETGFYPNGDKLKVVAEMTNGAFARHPFATDVASLRESIVKWSDLLFLNPTARFKAGILQEQKAEMTPSEKLIAVRSDRRNNLMAALEEAEIVVDIDDEEGAV